MKIKRNSEERDGNFKKYDSRQTDRHSFGGARSYETCKAFGLHLFSQFVDLPRLTINFFIDFPKDQVYHVASCFHCFRNDGF